MLKQLYNLSILFILLVVISGCKKQEDNVPYVFVDFSISLSLPEFTSLNSPGGWTEVTGGSQGIIIYRRTLEEFVAFDRHCSYKVQDVCRVNVDEETGITADCPCCNSTFSIYDGIPVNGPATVTLLDYRTAFNGNTNVLRIFNY